MKKAGFTLMLIGFVFFLAATSQATMWTDTHYPPDAPLYMKAGTPSAEYDFTLDIGKDGFDSSGWIRDFVLDYKVELYVADDLSGWRDWRDPLDLSGNTETLSVTTDRLFFGEGYEETYEVDFHLGLLNDPLLYDWNLSGWATLNAKGIIGINLTATSGDFYFYAGKVTASDHPIPEPASMLLLGLGLAGLAGFRRKFRK